MSTANNNSGKGKINNLKNISAEQLAGMNLDEINIYDLLEKNDTLKVKLTTVKGSKDGMYKKDSKKETETDKNFRSRVRKIRNTFTEKIIFYFSNKDNASLKKEIDSFIKFYKETYLLNDFSIGSVARLNSDKDTLAKLNLMFQIIKRSKVTEDKKAPKKALKSETKK